MSETVLDHGYVPEEHAPDPVIGHGDPTSPGKVAIWMFLASEIMFFIAILGTYIVLRAGAPHLFSEHAAALSKPWAGANTLVLIHTDRRMCAKPEGWPWWRRWYADLQLFLYPPVGLALSVLPALEAQTRLMFGAYIEYVVAEKG